MTKEEKDVGEAKKTGEIKFVSYEKSIPKLLDSLNFSKIIKNEKRIFLKPNLTICKAFPTTTDASFVEQIIKYIKKYNKKAEIIIAEGSGDDPTEKCFKKLGYHGLSDRYKIPLLDLDYAETKRIEDRRFKKFNFIEYPKALLSGFLISLPVLKEHSTAKVTISLKNMLGAFPKHQQGRNWKKIMHRWDINYSVHDIIACKMPDFAICDASIVQLENEIHGYPKEMDILLAGNALRVDKQGALLLGHDWKKVPHLVMIDELVSGR